MNLLPLQTSQSHPYLLHTKSHTNPPPSSTSQAQILNVALINPPTNSNHSPKNYSTPVIESSISRTNDSIRLSQKSSQVQNHRLSKDRDLIYYDPTSRPSARTRSGSVQGRAVDFDRPRESPFSNSNAILGGSSGESFSSASSVSTGGSRDSSREGRGRGRSESVGEMEANDGDRNHRRGRSIVGETIVEVLTPMTSRGERFDASHMLMDMSRGNCIYYVYTMMVVWDIKGSAYTYERRRDPEILELGLYSI
ncbi:hypothetical protein EYC80_008873 [Monilinia laxa]|uniref:Uncharacterized protein n=1 Tax=Monilinia laxa TaxID=61186 RepID=A0A5N6K1M8_MONLA|nr:hypothetical protein EYC80_008873 [Monilinia laxa]